MTDAVPMGAPFAEPAPFIEPTGAIEQLNVVHIVDSLRTGGAERLVAEFAKRASSVGVRCVVISLEAPASSPVVDDLAADGIDVRYVPSGGSRGLLDRERRRRLESLLVELSPELVHLHLETSIMIGGAAARRLGIPTVATVHNTTPFLGRWAKAKYLLLVRSLQRVDRVVVVGSSVAAVWRGRLNGTSLEILANPVRELPALDRKPGNSLLVAVGRLSAEKGTEDLIRAMQLIARERPEARLQIVGDGPEWRAVHNLIDQLELGGSIDLLGVRNDVGQILANSDIFVSASHSEGMPLSVLEAMAAGVPVVATGVGSVPDIVPDGAGELVAPGDHQCLAKAVLGYLDDPERGIGAGALGRDHVERHHHPDAWAARHVEIYRDVRAATEGRSR